MDQPEEITEGPSIRRFFFGDDGLRAGWSLLLFVITVALFGFLTNFILQHSHLIHKPTSPSAPMMPVPSIISEGVSLLVLMLAALTMSLIERRPIAAYGLPRRRMLPDLLAGMGWGCVCLPGLIGLLLLSHSLVFDGFAEYGRAAVVSGLEWLLAFFFVGCAEEFLTRGFLQYTLSRGVAAIVRAMSPTNRHTHAWGFWVTAFLFSGCLFMVGHIGNPGETIPGILAVGLAGTVFAFSLWRTGSLWWAIGIHTSWDWCQSYLFGVHDSGLAAAGHLLASHPVGRDLISGGSTGPEGSIFVIPVLLVMAAIIHFTLPRRIYPLTPDQSPPEDVPAHTLPSM